MPNTLYDQDLQLWIEQTIQQLQNHQFEALDIEHLIEELVDLGEAEKNALQKQSDNFAGAFTQITSSV